MTDKLYIAVDLGAGSGRVFLSGVDPGELLLIEIHRFHYPPLNENGNLRWNFPYIFDEIKKGLRSAAKKAVELQRPINSIGIDSWAVDYGLIDETGALISNPVCYRDDRTQGEMEKVFALVPRSEIFEKTGIQFLNFNTIFQLFSEHGNVNRARRLLMIPDLINFNLTGTEAVEYTNATTTQLVNARTNDWDNELLSALDLPTRIFPRIVPAGTDLGPLNQQIAAESGLSDVRVIAPATHDTGSAVACAPLMENWAYLSSGTWSLIGVERKRPLINREVESHNFTNEGGVYGTFRFLKNVMGLWIFELCRGEWIAKGIDVGYDVIITDVNRMGGFRALIFPDDKRFLNPPSMLGAIRQQIEETGQEFHEDPAAISKIIFDSLAFRYASVLRTIEVLTSEKLTGIQILGGGGKNRYLNQMTSNISRLTVKAGLTEATVVGNVLVQAIAAGRFASLDEARQHVTDNFEFSEYMPESSQDLDEAACQYAEIEARFLN